MFLSSVRQPAACNAGVAHDEVVNQQDKISIYTMKEGPNRCFVLLVNNTSN